MSTAYLVRVRPASGQDAVRTLQVVADSAASAAEAVRAVVAPDSIVDVEDAPVSSERAVEAGFTAGKPRVG